MNTVKRRWTIHKSYKRVKTLWEDYVAVASSSDSSCAEFNVSGSRGKKLWEFLTSFGVEFIEWTECGVIRDGVSLDVVFGDLTDVLKALLDTVTSLRDLSDPSFLFHLLTVVDLILQDPKYRMISVDYPDVVANLLSVVEQVDDSKLQIVTLKVLCLLAECPKVRLEMGRLNGYKTISEIMLNGKDEGLVEFVAGSLRSLITSEESSPIPVSDVSYLNGFRKILDGFRDVAVGEFNKYLMAFKKSEVSSSADSKAFFIPSPEDLDAICLAESLPLPRGNIVKSSNHAVESFLAFIRIQNVVDNLMHAIRSETVAVDVKIDLMETLLRIVSLDDNCLIQFNELGGFLLLRDFIDTHSDSLLAEDGDGIIVLFKIICTLILGKSPDKRVENMDAFAMMMDLSFSSRSYRVRHNACLLVQDMLSLNYINVAFLMRFGFADSIFEAISMQHEECADWLSWVTTGCSLLNYIGILRGRHDFDVVSGYLSLLSNSLVAMEFTTTQLLLKACRDLVSDLQSKRETEFSSLEGEAFFPCREWFIEHANTLTGMLNGWIDNIQSETIAVADGSISCFVTILQVLYEMIRLGGLTDHPYRIVLTDCYHNLQLLLGKLPCSADPFLLFRAISWTALRIDFCGLNAGHWPISLEKDDKTAVSFLALFECPSTEAVEFSALQLQLQILLIDDFTEIARMSPVSDEFLDSSAKSEVLEKLLLLVKYCDVSNSESASSLAPFISSDLSYNVRVKAVEALTVIIQRCPYWKEICRQTPSLDSCFETLCDGPSFITRTIWQFILEMCTDSFECISISSVLARPNLIALRGDVLPSSSRRSENEMLVYPGSDPTFDEFKGVLLKSIPLKNGAHPFKLTVLTVKEELSPPEVGHSHNRRKELRMSNPELRLELPFEAYIPPILTSRTGRSIHSRNISRRNSRGGSADLSHMYERDRKTAGHSRSSISEHLGMQITGIVDRTPDSYASVAQTHGSFEASTTSASFSPSKLDFDFAVSDSQLSSVDLGGITFSGLDAANRVLSLICSADPIRETSHRELFVVLNLLLEASPVNATMISRSGGLQLLLDRYLRNIYGQLGDVVDWQSLDVYKDLLISIGRTYIGEDTLKYIFDIAFDPRIAETDRIMSLQSTFCNSESTIAEFQMQLLDILQDLSESVDPRQYLYLSGDYRPIKVPFKKSPTNRDQFSIGCWMQCRNFSDSNVSFAAISDSDDAALPIIEILFKRVLPESNRHLSRGQSRHPKYCFCVRINCHTGSSEEIVFENYNFADVKWGYHSWTHFVLVNSRGLLTLYVNGCFVQSRNIVSNLNRIDDGGLDLLINYWLSAETIGYPSSPAECQSFVGRASSFVSESTTRFRGKVAALSVFDESIDISSARILFTVGVMEFDMSPGDKLTQKIICLLNPEVLSKRPRSKSKHSESTSFDDVSFDNGGLLILDAGRQEPEDFLRASADHSACIIRGSTIHSAFVNIGGPLLCLPFLEMSPPQQFGSLKLFVSLYGASQVISDSFVAINGWSQLSSVLSKYSDDISVDVFELLLDVFVSSTCSTNLSKHACITATIDLLANSQPNVRNVVYSKLVLVQMDILKNGNDNLSFLSLPVLLDGIQTVSKSCMHDLLKYLDFRLSSFSDSEIDQVLAFVSFERKHRPDLRDLLIDMLWRSCLNSKKFINRLSKVDTICFFVSLLEVNDGSTSTLKILQTIRLLVDNLPRTYRSAFIKANCFDAISLYLSSSCDVAYEVVASFLRLGLSIEKTVQDDASSLDSRLSVSIRRSSSAMQTQMHSTKNSLLSYPEVLRSVFDLLNVIGDSYLTTTVLSDVKKILTASNVSVLWEHPWHEWLSILMERDSTSSAVVGAIMSLVQKMMIFDVVKKSSHIMKCKGCVSEDENLQRLVIDAIFATYELSPCLMPDTAPDVGRNLIMVIKHAEDHMATSPEFFIQLVSFINAIVSQSSTATRTILKALGILDIRDDAVTKILLSEPEPAVLEAFLNTFAFEVVADQPKFQDSHGILILLRLCFKPSRNIRLRAHQILMECFCKLDYHSKAISLVIGENEVAEKFLSLKPEDFCDWYETSTPEMLIKKSAVEQHIEGLYLPLSNAFHKQRERNLARRNKRAQTYREFKLRNAERHNRALKEVIARCQSILQARAALHQKIQDELRMSRYERRKMGEEYWLETKRQLNLH